MVSNEELQTPKSKKPSRKWQLNTILTKIKTMLMLRKPNFRKLQLRMKLYKIKTRGQPTTMEEKKEFASKKPELANKEVVASEA